MAGGSNDLMKQFYQLLTYWFLAVLASFIGKPIKCPSLLLYLIFGAIAGNLGIVDPNDSALLFFSEWSITIVFFALGLEENVQHFMHSLKLSWGIALLGAVFPFISGYIGSMTFFSSEGWYVHITVATAVTATAVSLTMMLLQDQQLLKTKSAMGIMSSAVLDDIGCLVLVSILLPIVVAASPANALNEFNVPYNNVTGSFSVNSTGFDKILGDASAIEHAKHVFGADLALMTNMSRVNVNVSMSISSAGGFFTFTNAAPADCRSFSDAFFHQHISNSSNGSWLTLFNEEFGPLTNYQLTNSSHVLVNVTYTEPAEPKSGISVLTVLWICVKVGIFLIIIWFLHVVVLPNNVTEGWVSKIPLVRSYGIKNLLEFDDGAQVPLISITFGLALGMCGVSFGFHPAVGAYFAGLLLDESYFFLPDDKINNDKPHSNKIDAVTNNDNNGTLLQNLLDDDNRAEVVLHEEEDDIARAVAEKRRLRQVSSHETDLATAATSPVSPISSHSPTEAAEVLPSGVKAIAEMEAAEHLQNSSAPSEHTITTGQQQQQQRTSFTKTRDAVATFAFNIIGPVFFLHLGSAFEVKAPLLATAIPKALGITVLLFIFQFVSAALSARYVPWPSKDASGNRQYNYTWAECILIGFGMLGRAELFFVVLNAAKAGKVINQEIFFTMALVALLMNVSLVFCVPLFKGTYLKYETWEPSNNKENNNNNAGSNEYELMSPTIQAMVSKDPNNKWMTGEQ